MKGSIKGSHIRFIKNSELRLIKNVMSGRILKIYM